MAEPVNFTGRGAAAAAGRLQERFEIAAFMKLAADGAGVRADLATSNAERHVWLTTRSTLRNIAELIESGEYLAFLDG